MTRAGAGIIVVAILALAGCRSMDSKDDKSPSGLGANRPKNKDAKEPKGSLAKGPSWLDDVEKLPGAGTNVPKAGSWTNPSDPNFNAKNEAQDAVGGRVYDLYGKPARNVFVRIDALGAPPGGAAAIGIYTDDKGVFYSRGLKPGKSYELTVEATQEGKPLLATVQTRVPNPTLEIILRENLAAPGGGSGAFPPEPKPAEKVGDYIPPMGYVPTTPKPPGEAWSPGGPTTGVPPASIGTKPPVGVAPAEPIVPPAIPPKPENVADGPKDKFKPPPASIPGPGSPPVPPLPVLPPSFAPPAPTPTPSRGASGNPVGSSGITANVNKFALLDVLERSWESDTIRPGALVLVEFMTSTCAPCKQVIPILKDFQSRYGAYGLQVMGVMCDDLPQRTRADTAAKYTRDHNLNYLLYVEPGKAGTVRDRFDVESYPTTVLLDSTGKVLWKGNPGTQRTQLEAAIKQGLGK